MSSERLRSSFTLKTQSTDKIHHTVMDHGVCVRVRVSVRCRRVLWVPTWSPWSQ